MLFDVRVDAREEIFVVLQDCGIYTAKYNETTDSANFCT